MTATTVSPVISPAAGQVLANGDIWVYGYDGPGWLVPRAEWDRRNAARAALDRIEAECLTVGEVRGLVGWVAGWMSNQQLSVVLDAIVDDAAGVALLTRVLDARPWEDDDDE